VVASLERGGLLQLLLASNDSWALPELARATGANLGPLSVVMRGLECEGLISRECVHRAQDTQVALTSQGREVATLPGLRRRVEQLLACPAEQREPRFLGDSQQRWQLPEGATGDRWALFLDGFLALEPVLRLRREGKCRSGLLQRLGWVDQHGERTERGGKAAKLGYTYLFPWSYRPLLASLDDLLFGRSDLFQREEGEPEEHLSRAEDISFSGTLSVDVCAACAYPGLAARFDTAQGEEQPQFLADTGCGDGRLLATLGGYIAQRTSRGQRLEEHPLWLVGVDQEAVARAVAQETLAQTGLRALVLPGDIADPEALALALRDAGLDPHRGLHLSKSVLHDRTYRGPRSPEQAASRQALSSGAFIDDANQPVDNAYLEQDLVETLARWAPYCQRHGMLLFEAHTAAPSLIQENLHRNWSPGFDIIQGLSHQYPMELAVLHGALREAGYTIESWTDPTQGFCGFATMSMNWLRHSS
jgi:hypothetical protein